MKSFVQIKSRSDLKVGFSDEKLEMNRKQKQRYERMLKNLHAKEDDGSLFLSNFNPMSDRKTKRQRRRPRRRVVEERINTKDKDRKQVSEESDAEKHSMYPVPTAEKPSSDEELEKNRKQKQKYERVLKNLHAKEDESSKFLSDFNSSNDRKAKSRVNPNLCWSF